MGRPIGFKKRSFGFENMFQAYMTRLKHLKDKHSKDKSLPKDKEVENVTV